MIITNLVKRIFSSIILFLFLLIIIYSEKIYFLIIIIILSLLILYELSKLIQKLLFKVIWFVFIIFSSYSIYEISSYGYQKEFFIFLLLISISTDIGGFVIGKIFGGPKLTKISPNKTYSGAIGGVCFAILFGYIFLYKTDLIIINSNYYFLSHFFMITFLSFTSQIGDLCISYLKRNSNVKDTGNIIPGHGGILDRLDGIIFVFPIYFIINFLMN